MSAIVECPDRRIMTDTVHWKARSYTPSGGVHLGIGGMVAAVGKRLTAWLDERRMVNELGKLDDRLLRDIGVDPAKLPPRLSAGDLRHIADLLTPPRR